jgi:hypothetical protein
VPGDAVDLVGERERVFLEPNAIARLGRKPLGFLRLRVHAGHRTSVRHSFPNGAGDVAIPR